ncbi:MAG: carboxylating nicotinate-nucleotide diphosphorylase [Heliobacteriaceae bacterium]|jgi:nicotinate-nucleotide pyrophosphorylase (carboxylating)|nr:carboxylating nicotinate-nucleotide diphosphorylase [Heliobacteriaceae bacterium]
MLTDFYIKDHVKHALEEDIGFGDITTESLANGEINAQLNAREGGILCGCKVFTAVFNALSPDVKVDFHFEDGDTIKAGNKLADISGPAKHILTGERVALNYIQRMSGIATETQKYADLARPAKIADTRKTTPNFRPFEKYAVKVGGGSLHRFNLSDCAMIKDNHIRFAGSVTEAVRKVRKNISHAHKIEVECDTLEQVNEALACRADIIMLDNMPPAAMREACQIIDKRTLVEASGNVTLDTVSDIAATGVDIISTSAIVTKAHALDLALDM